MAKDDFDVIQFKVLSYLYRCAKDGVRPVPAKAREFAGVNDVYFEAVMEDLLDCKYAACSVRGFPPGSYRGIRITSGGFGFLRDDDGMRRAAAFLGSAFESVLALAIEATRALQ